jgi:hypothetical protein
LLPYPVDEHVRELSASTHQDRRCGAVGNYMDNQQQEFERALAEETARDEI